MAGIARKKRSRKSCNRWLLSPEKTCPTSSTQVIEGSLQEGGKDRNDKKYKQGRRVIRVGSLRSGRVARDPSNQQKPLVGEWRKEGGTSQSKIEGNQGLLSFLQQEGGTNSMQKTRLATKRRQSGSGNEDVSDYSYNRDEEREKELKRREKADFYRSDADQKRVRGVTTEKDTQSRS